MYKTSKITTIVAISLIFLVFYVFTSYFAFIKNNIRAQNNVKSANYAHSYVAETPVPSPILTKNFKRGRRGLAILALLHKNFPVEEAYEILRESDRPAFSFLYGEHAFGADPTNYYKLMSMFLEEGRSVHVEIYTLCGACRPPRISNLNLASFCRKKNVNELAKAFAENKKIKRKYKRWLTGIKEEFVDPYPEMTFTVTISLEDNDKDNWKVVRKKGNAIRYVFKGYSNVQFARNNVGALPYGYSDFKVEIHTTESRDLKILGKGAIVSFDGDFFNYPGQDLTKEDWWSSSYHVTSFKEVKKVIREARKRKIDVYVWRPEFQGTDTKPRQHPNKRNYRFPKKKFLKKLMNL
jgi:hypothetical protein